MLQVKDLRFPIIFMLCSLVVFIVGLVLAIRFVVIAPINKGKTTATILEARNYTKVKYVVNGKTYIKTYSFYSSTYYDGKTIKIYYDKSNPSDSFVANMRFLWLIGPGVGIILLGTSGIILWEYYVKYKKDSVSSM